MTTTPDTFTPALGRSSLTALYDLAIRILTRETTWRAALVQHIAPRPGAKILDVGCGTGSLLLDLWRTEPTAEYLGLDPDHDVLALARKKLAVAGSGVNLQEGFLSEAALPKGWHPDTVASSLVLHQTPLPEKRRIIQAIYDVLPEGGRFFLADYSTQDTSLMRWLFRNTVQRLDGLADTQPNADGILPELLGSAGFKRVDDVECYATPTGLITIYVAVA
jgi:ubiquinone/menaquinone biosynthesis C-methylase UbiE